MFINENKEIEFTMLKNWIGYLKETQFYDIALRNILLASIFIFIALFLKNTISTWIAKILHKIYKKWSISDTWQEFENYVLKPLQNLIYTFFLYLAFHQFYSLFAEIVLLKQKNIFVRSGILKSSKTLSLGTVIEHVFLFFLFYFLISLIARTVDFVFHISLSNAQKGNNKEKQQILPLLRDVVKVIIWFLGVLLILSAVFNVNVGTIVAGLGIGGIAIAFAAKDSLENLIASFMVLIDKPFLIGDLIKIDKIEGRVERIGFRSTRIRSVDRSLIIVPNKKLIDNQLENMSETGKRRVLIHLKISYGLQKESILALQEEIQKCIEKTNGTIEKPLVYIDTVNADTLQITVRYFIIIIKELRSELVRQEVNLKIYEILNKYVPDFKYIEEERLQK